MLPPPVYGIPSRIYCRELSLDYLENWVKELFRITPEVEIYGPINYTHEGFGNTAYCFMSPSGESNILVLQLSPEERDRATSCIFFKPRVFQ